MTQLHVTTVSMNFLVQQQDSAANSILYFVQS